MPRDTLLGTQGYGAQTPRRSFPASQALGPLPRLPGVLPRGGSIKRVTSDKRHSLRASVSSPPFHFLFLPSPGTGGLPLSQGCLSRHPPGFLPLRCVSLGPWLPLSGPVSSLEKRGITCVLTGSSKGCWRGAGAHQLVSFLLPGGLGSPSRRPSSPFLSPSFLPFLKLAPRPLEEGVCGALLQENWAVADVELTQVPSRRSWNTGRGGGSSVCPCHRLCPGLRP